VAKPFLIGIAGGSGSGKTTFAKRVIEEGAHAGIEGAIFSLDHYYRPLSHLSFEERCAFNFDDPAALDLELAVSHVKKLVAGETIRQPVYDFKTHTRTEEETVFEPKRLIVVEGLYALRPKPLLELYDYKIFVSTGIATAVLRRMARDVSERGRDVDGAKHQIITTVVPMYEEYVKPTSRNAHFSINWEGEEIPEKATEGLVGIVRDHLR
jgi:uridine kinase